MNERERLALRANKLRAASEAQQAANLKENYEHEQKRSRLQYRIIAVFRCAPT